MTRTRVVIQSRLNSSRLPGKALMSIGGMPLIELVARRASRSGHEVIVATSEEHYDNRIAQHLTTVGIPVIRGPLDDVLHRFVAATADLDDEDRVIRLTGDNPVADADLVDELLAAMTASGNDYGRVDIDQVPEGLGAEAFWVRDLRRADATTRDPYDREHVTPWLRRTLGELLFAPEANPGDPLRFRCTIDVLSDYDRVAGLFDGVDDAVAIPWSDLIARLDHKISAEGATVPSRQHRSLSQSVLTIGGAQLSGPRSSAPPEVRTMLARAVDHGVTHVEVGRADGNAERILRSCGEPQLTQRLKFISRLRPLSYADPLAAGLAVEASLERSFAELGRRSVAAALLSGADQVHLGGGAAWRRLRDYRDSGEVAAAGVALSHAGDAANLLEVEGLDYLELPFNVTSGPLPEAVRTLAGRGVVVLAHSAYGGGRLLAGTDGLGSRLAQLAERTGREGIADLLLGYCLGHPEIASVAVGAATDDEMRHNLDLAAREPLSATQIDEVQEAMR